MVKIVYKRPTLPFDYLALPYDDEDDSFPVVDKLGEAILKALADSTLGDPLRESTISALAEDVVAGITWKDLDNKTRVVLTGLAIPFADLEAGITNTDSEQRYQFYVSLLNGRVTVIGSDGSDTGLEVGAGGKATVEGKGGNDRLYVWHEKDIVFDGGKGVDTIEFSWSNGFFVNPTAGAVVNLKNGTGTNPWGGTLKLENVERVIGEFNHDNNLRGDDGNNVLMGGIAADTLRGGDGDDEIYVKYFGGVGDRGTFADGGKGKDILNAELTGVGDVLDLLDPDASTGTFAGGTFKNFEIIRFSTYFAQHVDFRGSDRAETVSATSGDDILDGRKGNDKLTGFSGSDHFVFSTALKGNVDRITDFVHGVDEIDLSPGIFAALGAALDPGEFRAGGKATDADDRIIYKQSTGELFFDRDGKGGADQILFAVLTSKPAVLDSGDFAILT